MKLLVTGGRDFEDFDLVCKVLDDVHAKQTVTLLIEGGARGADTLAKKWAISRGVTFVEEKARWNELGKAAGLIRNQLMIDKYKPDLCVAFPGGRGTADCTWKAIDAGIEVRKVRKGEEPLR